MRRGVEAVEEALEKARAASALNAVVALRTEASQEVRMAPQGPLQGLPVLVKDMFVDHGRPPTCGSLVHAPGLSGTARLIRRLRDAGAVVIGYSNLHEWGVGTTSVVTASGPIVNPARPGRCAGGSSGGSAAALAAGIVPAAIGTDAGGSIRVPSAYCGTAGLKPTFGRVPLQGAAVEGDPVDHAGPMAKSVGDLVPLLAALCGDLEELPDPGALRVGVAGGSFADVTEEIAAALEEALDMLAPRVAAVSRLEIGGVTEAGSAVGAMVLSFTAARLGTEWERRSQELQPETRQVLQMGAAMGGEEPPGYQRVREACVAGWKEAFEKVDLVVTPTVSAPPPPIGDPLVDTPSGLMHADVMNIAFNGPMNLAGIPALSMPCGEGEGGTINLTISGPPGKDEWVLATGLALERALGA